MTKGVQIIEGLLYPERVKIYTVTPQRKRLIKSLARCQGLSFAKQAFSNENYRCHTIMELKRVSKGVQISVLRNG